MQQTESPNTVICTPVRDVTTPEYDHAVTHNSPRAAVLQVAGLPVNSARNALVRAVLEMSPRPEFVAWIDDDAYFLKFTCERLVSSLIARPDIGLITGWCGNRSLDSGTNIIRIVDDPYAIEQAPPGAFSTNAIVVERMTRPDDLQFGGPPVIAECDFVASHLVIHRTALLDLLEPEPFTPTSTRPGPEDFEFCGRVREVGFKIAADITLPIWHMGHALVDFVRRPVGFIPGCQPCEISLEDGIPRPILGKDLRKVDDRRAYGAAVGRKLDMMGRDLIWRRSFAEASAAVA